jgi:alcohol dehydrogenase class IV
MQPITLHQPKKIVFGAGTRHQLPTDCLQAGYRRLLLLYTSPLKGVAEELSAAFAKQGLSLLLLEYAFGEPTIAYFHTLLERAVAEQPDCVIGLGGGSVLDTAKLIAALWDHPQPVTAVFGKNLLDGRRTGLLCLPTTAGTGSEVSPNAILLDESDSEKKGVISPFLVPDSCYIDPMLTTGLPPRTTAETAMDALSHCIEAYTNRFAHPVTDAYALAGIRLIAAHLERAYHDGADLEARSALALGSLYGGYCLGPVNTAAVHALSYGLGGKYHLSHGLANAMLLPSVLRFNLPAAPQKFCEIATAMGAETAEAGIERLTALSITCNIPQRLSDLGIDASEIDTLAGMSMKVTRLLVNNPREVTREDAINIYQTLF